MWAEPGQLASLFGVPFLVSGRVDPRRKIVLLRFTAALSTDVRPCPAYFVHVSGDATSGLP
jgi:hypothetical protein